MVHETFHVFDTTLRDGAQREGINLTVADKLTIARYLDDFGVGFIEGGWPGANPRDTEFFAHARHELDLEHAQLVAFGATRRAGISAAEDPHDTPHPLLALGVADVRVPFAALAAVASGVAVRCSSAVSAGAVGSVKCAGKCKVTKSTFPSQVMSQSKEAVGQFFLDTTIRTYPKGDVGEGQATASWNFTKPGATPSNPLTLPTTPVRCDNALPGTTKPGCVMPYIPDRLVGDDDPTLEHEFAERQREAEVQPHTLGDDLDRVPVTLVQQRRTPRGRPLPA